MCLAIPAKVIERDGDTGCVDLGSARIPVNLMLTPEANVGDWVLVHAGFAIRSVDEEDAKETWKLLEEVYPAENGTGTDRPDRAGENGTGTDRPDRAGEDGTGTDRPDRAGEDGTGTDRPDRSQSHFQASESVEETGA